MRHCGIDVHLRYSEICEVDGGGEVVGRQRLSTAEASLRRFFGDSGSWRVVLESSGMSAWVVRVLEALGHEVVVKAVVALARKIGVLLHHLWVTGESFEPFPQAA